MTIGNVFVGSVNISVGRGESARGTFEPQQPVDDTKGRITRSFLIGVRNVGEGRAIKKPCRSRVDGGRGKD